MGKVTVQEPIKGEALTATKINSTIASWTTEASNINGENVHDQSLENYNFEENAVTSVKSHIHRGTPLVRFANKSAENKAHKIIYFSPTSLDFTNNKHIFRGSYHIFAYPDYSSVSSTMHFQITTKLFASYTGFGGIFIPGTERTIRYEGDQLDRQCLDETISYCTVLNNITALQVTGTVSGLKIYLEVIFSHDNRQSQSDCKMGVYGHFSEVETIKR